MACKASRTIERLVIGKLVNADKRLNVKRLNEKDCLSLEGHAQGSSDLIEQWLSVKNGKKGKKGKSKADDRQIGGLFGLCGTRPNKIHWN